ncbi:MAG: hypothetical protein RIB46_16415 [Pseudomonadales bacterium]
MIPRLSQGLADLAAKLARDIAPEAGSRYAMANTGMVSMLLGALALDAERAVDARMTDIDEIKSLLRSAPADAEPARQPAAAAFLDRTPRSLRLTDVDAVHAEGMNLLIALHDWAEHHDADLDSRIWDFLVRHSERHRLDPGD